MLLAYWAARDDLAQNHADISRVLDSRNQNGVVGGFSVAAAAAGGGLLATSPRAIGTVTGVALIVIGAMVALVVLARAILDHRVLVAAQARTPALRRMYAESRNTLIATCPQPCWPAFTDP